MSLGGRRSNQPLEPFVPEIDRHLRHLRQASNQGNTIEEGNNQHVPVNTPENSPPPSHAGSESEGENEMENLALFGEFGTPGSYAPQGGILLPTTATNYQIHPQYTRMVKEEVFCGLKHECPLEHLERFMEICDLIPPCPDNEDYVKLHLFRASLSGDAKDWYKCLEPNSLRTWVQVRTAFLERFYPTVRTQDWRKKIAAFTQEDEESLGEAWTRFKRMIRACPHHEFGENHLNTFFYDGLNDQTKALLDSSVGGQLSKIPQRQVKARIEEVVKNSSWGG